MADLNLIVDRINATERCLLAKSHEREAFSVSGDGTAFGADIGVSRDIAARSTRGSSGRFRAHVCPEWLDAGDIFLDTASIDNMPASVLVRAGDADAMAMAICRLVNDAPLAQRRSANANSTAHRFMWERDLPDWEAARTSVVASARR